MSKKRPGCFKFGCIGCASVLVIGFGLIFLLAGIQLTQDSTPEPIQQAAEHNLPAPPPLPAGDFASDRPESTIQLAEGDLPASSTSGGTLVLDVSMTELTIVPGPADEPLRVNGDFDSNAFRLTEELTTDDNGDWVYNVSFGGKGGMLGLLFRGGGQNTGNALEIVVPRGHPISFKGKVGIGESRMNLGGLWVQDVDLDYATGDHFLEFREPIPFPMGSFDIKSSMGELEIRGVGDASPETVRVKHGMGSLFLDLQGAWRRDASARVDFKMGECKIWVPENARVQLDGGKVAMGESRQNLPDYADLPEDAPAIALKVRGSMGEMRIDH